MSSWNFDIVALKAQADMEPDEPLLPTIKECDDDMTLSGIDRCMAAEFVAATMQAAATDAAANGMSAFGEKGRSHVLDLLQGCACRFARAVLASLRSRMVCAQQPA